MSPRIRCRFRFALATTVGLSMLEFTRPVSGQVTRCLSVTQRTAELWCWVIADQIIDVLPTVPSSWFVDAFPSRAAAALMARPGSTILETFGKVWLLTVADTAWRPAGRSPGTHVAAIGPLPVTPGASYGTQYLKADFMPGIKSIVHRHGGPEVWYTASGETCLETPTGKLVGRPGQPDRARWRTDGAHRHGHREAERPRADPL